MFLYIFIYLYTIKDGEVACCGNEEPKFDQPNNNKITGGYNGNL